MYLKYKNMYAKSKQFLQYIPYASIWELVWPQTVMMLCTIVISLTDIWTAGKINADIQASIGISAQLQALFMVMGTALGAASMAAVSQSIGAKNYKRAKRYTGIVIIFAHSMAVLIAILGYFFRFPIMSLLQVPSNILELSITFYIFILCGLPGQYILNVSATLFRATKNVKTPLLIVCIIAIFNVFGDLALGLGYFGFPKLGGIGIAITTVCSVYLGAILALFAMVKSQLFMAKIIPSFIWIKKASPYLFKVALPAILMQTLWHLGYLTLFGVLAALPNSVYALAGMTSGMRLESVLFMPAVAFNMTASIMVGNALGAGKIIEAKRLGLAIIIFASILMSIVAACMWPFRELLAQTFSHDAETEWNIMMYLTINILSTPFTVAGLVVNGIFVGAGATIYALITNPFCIWCIRLPLAWLLAHYLEYGSMGVFIAMLISMMIQASAMFTIFLTQNWTRFTMKKHRETKETK